MSEHALSQEQAKSQPQRNRLMQTQEAPALPENALEKSKALITGTVVHKLIKDGCKSILITPENENLQLTIECASRDDIPKDVPPAPRPSETRKDF